MPATAEIVEVLGGRRTLDRPVRTPEELNAQIRKGFPYAALEALAARFGLRREQVSSALDLPERTLVRRKQEQRLRPVESDRLFRLARIAAQAVEVLGDQEKAARWLHRSNRSLGGQPPLALLDTDLGSRQVEEVLGRIEHGVFS